MNRDERNERFVALKSMGCIACIVEGLDVWCGAPEIHHLNSFGLAGHKRRGDEFTIVLGAWHHRGVLRPRMSRDAMTGLYGPSLAIDSRQFRFSYGTDDQLLALTNAKLARLLPVSA